MTVSDGPTIARRRRAALPAFDDAVLPDDLRAILAGSLAVFLMLFWSVDDGGTDAGIWYWGALLSLAGVAGLLVATRGALASLPRATKIALVCFGLYVAWSYLSMTWAAYAGLALQGANRALLYLLVFTLLAAVPWRRPTALVVLGAYGGGHRGDRDRVVVPLRDRRQHAAGCSSTAGLIRRPATSTPTRRCSRSADWLRSGSRPDAGALPMRGLYAAFAAADLMLAFTPQSRGWLFTLPVVGLFSVLVAAERLRCIAIVIAAAAGLLVDIRPLLRLFQVASAAALTDAAIHAGKIGLLSCAGVFGLVTLRAR